MDKVSQTSPQAMPLWERRKSSRGHRSAVDGALAAHRQRKSERQARTQERLNMVRGLQTQFFPGPQSEPKVEMQPNVMNRPMQATAPITQEQEVVPDNQFFTQRQIDYIYDDAQLSSTADNVLAVVNKEIANPEEQPMEDVPKGSYIDYTV